MGNIIRKYSCFLVIMLFIITNACDKYQVYEKNINIPKKIWDRNNIIKFEVLMQDTVSLHNVYINLRNSGKYQYSNIYFFIKTTAPSGLSIRDTVQIILANRKGKWFGKGFGDLWSHQHIYKKDILFSQRGVYTFEIEQAMRIEQLPYIHDIGIRIERAHH